MSVALVAGAADRRILDERGGSRAMTWIMAIMLFLTVLAAATGLGMVNAAAALDRQLAGRLTVQVVDADQTKRDRDTAAVMAALAQMPAVKRATPVDRTRLTDLLRPWLGDASSDADVPLPSLIDVDMSVPSEESAARVAAGVRAVAPGARVDAQSRWLSPVADFMRTMIAAAVALVLLMAAATSAAVLLAVRAGLETHRDTIAILHILGSTDVQVARLFQRRIALDTMVGGAIGTVAAMIATWAITRQMASMGSELLGGAVLGQRDWLLLAALPIVFALVATVAARVAVLRRLRLVQ
ncbi:cell division protein FtsX [Sphingomonas sp.]|jgi:cell division transport system permease protein|uniref:cell division protein FtsX n=1 Tax=Sphingomonas sp. TaxID=28214 RepID=UPI002E2FE116|nr:FtsX-like permease family protein [Sphingomonas sp.]HEX4695403.1 FtsX-like permease family protein [Sphingomonas sp.]